MIPRGQMDLFPDVPRIPLAIDGTRHSAIAPARAPDLFDKRAVRQLSKSQRACVAACAAVGELAPTRYGWSGGTIDFPDATVRALERLNIVRVVFSKLRRSRWRVRLTERGVRLASVALALNGTEEGQSQ